MGLLVFEVCLSARTTLVVFAGMLKVRVTAGRWPSACSQWLVVESSYATWCIWNDCCVLPPSDTSHWVWCCWSVFLLLSSLSSSSSSMLQTMNSEEVFYLKIANILVKMKYCTLCGKIN